MDRTRRRLFRVAELILAQRNTKRLLANGGREFGRRHYPLFVLLHGGWLLVLFSIFLAQPRLITFFWHSLEFCFVDEFGLLQLWAPIGRQG